MDRFDREKLENFLEKVKGGNLMHLDNLMQSLLEKMKSNSIVRFKPFKFQNGVKIQNLHILAIWLQNLNVGNLKTRFTLPDVDVEWREIGENILLVLLSVLLYMSVIFTELSFVPFMIIVIKRGWKEGLMYLVIGTGAVLYLMIHEIGKLPLDGDFILFSPTHYSFSFIERVTGLRGGRFLDFFFIFGFFGIVLGYFVSKNYRLNYVIFFSLAVYVGIAVLPLIISGLLGGFNQFIVNYSSFVDVKTNSYVDQYLSQVSNHRVLLMSRGIDYSLISRKIELAADLYKKNVIFGIAPRGGYLVKQIFIIFIGILSVKFYLTRKHISRAALSFSIKNYCIHDSWVWALIIAWGLVYINLRLKNQIFGIISWNIAVVFSLLFFLRGLSIIKILADRIRIPQLLQYMVLIFFLFYSFIFFVTVVTGIGVADIWLEIHKNIEKMKKRSGS